MMKSTTNRDDRAAAIARRRKRILENSEARIARTLGETKPVESVAAATEDELRIVAESRTEPVESADIGMESKYMSSWEEKYSKAIETVKGNLQDVEAEAKVEGILEKIQVQYDNPSSEVLSRTSSKLDHPPEESVKAVLAVDADNTSDSEQLLDAENLLKGVILTKAKYYSWFFQQVSIAFFAVACALYLKFYSNNEIRLMTHSISSASAIFSTFLEKREAESFDVDTFNLEEDVEIEFKSEKNLDTLGPLHDNRELDSGMDSFWYMDFLIILMVAISSFSTKLLVSSYFNVDFKMLKSNKSGNRISSFVNLIALRLPILKQAIMIFETGSELMLLMCQWLFIFALCMALLTQK